MRYFCPIHHHRLSVIEIQASGTTIQAIYRSGLDEPVPVDLSAYAFLGDDGLTLLRVMTRYIDRLLPRSAAHYLKVVVDIGRALKRTIEALPTGESGWQDLVLRVHEDILSNTESNASLKTRMTSTLSTANTLFSHLKEEGMIPLGVVLPETIRLYKSIDSTPHATSPLIGGGTSKRAQDPKLLCDISLSRTDAAYLDYVRGELTRRRTALREALLGYWESLRSHVLWGEKARAEVDTTALKRALEEKRLSLGRGSGIARDPAGLLRPDDPKGLANLIAYISTEFGRVPTKNEFANSQFLPMVIRRDSHFAIASCPELVWTVPDKSKRVPQESSYPIPRNELLGFSMMRLRWLLGFISSADIAVMSALLIMDHPRFTPEAVTQARLVNRKGKRYFQTTDSGNVFEVHKHRAHAIKDEHLTDLGVDIINFAATLFAATRNDLQKSGNPLADRLFIQVSYPTFKPRAPAHFLCGSFLSGAKLPSRAKIPTGDEGSRWLGDFSPALREAGLIRRTISLRKIRNTEGVLEWFRTQNLSAVANKLGNKTRTVIEHYIPRTLLLAWNTRLARRFQNLWISVAAANEPYLLEVTDFSSLSELHTFLADMLNQHPARTSPLAWELHQRHAAHTSSKPISLDSTNAKLSVSVSKESLAALYLYHDAALRRGASEGTLDKADANGCSPRHFIDLSTLLRNRLPLDPNPRHRQAHDDALQLTQKLAPNVAWEDLFVWNTSDA